MLPYAARVAAQPSRGAKFARWDDPTALMRSFRSPRQGCANVTAAEIAANLRERARQRERDGAMRDRAFARPHLAELYRRSLIGLAALALLLFSGCERAP